MQLINNRHFTRETIWTSKSRITSPKPLFYQLDGYPQIIICNVNNNIVINNIYVFFFLFWIWFPVRNYYVTCMIMIYFFFPRCRKIKFNLIGIFSRYSRLPRTLSSPRWMPATSRWSWRPTVYAVSQRTPACSLKTHAKRCRSYAPFYSTLILGSWRASFSTQPILSLPPSHPLPLTPSQAPPHPRLMKLYGNCATQTSA